MLGLAIFLILPLAGAGMLFIGARGLFTRRATVYSGKWLLALIAVCFLPMFLNSLHMFKMLPAAALFNLV